MNLGLRITFAQLYLGNGFKTTCMYVKSHATMAEQDKKTNTMWQALHIFNTLTKYAHIL